MMNSDLQGNEVTNASSKSLEAYQQAVTAFNLYRGDPIALLDNALETSPDFPMAHIAKGFMLALSSEPVAIEQAWRDLSRVRELKMNDRERSLLHAAQVLSAGRWNETARMLNLHNMRFPLDLLGLQAGHLLDFYCADSRNMRERIARALPFWSEQVPGYSVLLGMYAFGLEEDGHYPQAEDTGRKALAMEPFDCWAHHAVAHVMEMQGRPEDGIGWMLAREPYWSEEVNFFKVHNWWHRAVFHIDLGQTDHALALYDSAVRHAQSPVALELVDASALLWRLHLCGVDVGRRWDELAQVWCHHADGKTYPFNDWHAAMAFLGAGRDQELNTLMQTMRESLVDSPSADWIKRVGLPLVQGFVAFWRSNYQEAALTLLSARRFAGAFGGSHAQRDIIDLTLIEAALRGGLHDIYPSLINERTAIRPYSRMTLDFSKRGSLVKDAGLGSRTDSRTKGGDDMLFQQLNLTP